MNFSSAKVFKRLAWLLPVVSILAITAISAYSQTGVVTTNDQLGVKPLTETGGGFLYSRVWSPYLVGICIGMLSWLTFLLSDHPIGVSSAVARTGGMLETAVRGQKAKEKPYYQKLGLNIGWEWVFVVGIVIGAFLSAKLSGDFQIHWIPAMWEQRFGHNIPARIGAAFIGGVILMIGARWAGGCTSGHGISGTLQLVISSWVALVSFFVGGAITAFLIY
ncbi:MAG: YeeE/YedE thiosulfate transporter family protein [Desulfococcaceae bacterium]